MKAIVNTEYGSPNVLKFEVTAKPTPKDNEVLIKVHATSINAADSHMMQGTPFIVRLMGGGIRKPKNTILGADVAGVVEVVGKDVTEFQIGDGVFGDLSSSGWGGLAQYVTAPEDMLVQKPSNITFEEAAAVPMAGVTAANALRDNVKPGQKVLINGASGGVGTYALQIAKALGAEVTAVCSTRNVEQSRMLGADHVIDYKQEDFTQNGQQYDVILAANGDTPLKDYANALTPEGVYVCSGGSTRQVFGSMLMSPFVTMGNDKTMGGLFSKPDKDMLAYLAGLLEDGQMRSVIDRTYPLSETADAFLYLGEGHAQGKIVVTMGQG